MDVNIETTHLLLIHINECLLYDSSELCAVGQSRHVLILPALHSYPFSLSLSPFLLSPFLSLPSMLRFQITLGEINILSSGTIVC